MQKRKEKGCDKYKPSLLKALARAFGFEYAVLGFFTFMEECVIRYLDSTHSKQKLQHLFSQIRILQPLFVSWFIRSFSPGAKESTSETEVYLLGLGVVAMAAVYTFTHHPYFFGVMRVGMSLRIALSSIIYRKVSKLRNNH